MKRQIILMTMMAVAMPVLAQDSNSVSPPELKTSEAVPPANEERKKPSSEQRKELQERHLQLMEKALNDIGVTGEQRKQIVILQEAHMEKMKENWKRINDARRKLSALQDNGAPMDELDVAIKEVSDAQTEQLRILVRNRLEMERILGKEKSDQFMEKARQFYRSHGRRPGAGMPPRPNVPPLPGAGNDADTPPEPPPSHESAGIPPLP